MILAHWPIVLSLLAFADVTVAPARSDRANTSFYRDLAALDRPTERTVETLRRYDLESRYRRDAAGRDRQPRSRGPADARRRARLRAGRALVARGEAARSSPPGRGARPLRRRRRLRLRVPLRPRAGRGPPALRPAVPARAEPLQRRARPPDPRGAGEPEIRPARARRQVHLQGPRPRAGLPRLPRPGEVALEARGRRPAHPLLRLRGRRPAVEDVPARRRRAADRRPQERPLGARGREVPPERDGVPAHGVPPARVEAPRDARRRPARVRAGAGRPGPPVAGRGPARRCPSSRT